jgi:CDP-glucose 4,6-dehydratase
VEFGEGTLEDVGMNPEFWSNRKVFLTGHTGFKGSWLSLWLQTLGARVVGYSLPPPTDPSLYVIAHVEEGMESIVGDVLDLERLLQVLRRCQPEVAIHMAAQSLVRHSYTDPVGTFATNVLGTVHILQAIRTISSVRSVIIVTTDKCYSNSEDLRAFRETDALGGADPYSSSKACAELVTDAFRKSFFPLGAEGKATGIASVRAGNVIGGGDWAPDRLIPDVMRAAHCGQQVCIRNPHAVRPWQHVLDPLCGYLTLAEKLCEDPARFSESWNFGPEESEPTSVVAILEHLQRLWGDDVSWRIDGGPHPHEAQCLMLDCRKAKERLGWEPQWNLRHALEATVQWYKAHQSRQNMRSISKGQIRAYQRMLTATEVSAK